MHNTERRKLPRVPVKLPVQLHCEAEQWLVTLLELSEEGGGLETPVVLSPGQQCQLHVNLTVADEVFTLNLDIEVIHTTKVNKNYMIGVHFISLSPAYRYALKRFINYQKLIQG